MNTMSIIRFIVININEFPNPLYRNGLKKNISLNTIVHGCDQYYSIHYDQHL